MPLRNRISTFPSHGMMPLRAIVLGLIVVVVTLSTAAAQSVAALEEVTAGFGRGQCNPLTHVALNPESRAWMNIDPSPWTG